MSKLLIIVILVLCSEVLKTSYAQDSNSTIHYLDADKLPRFGNSYSDLKNYIYENIKWPQPFDGSDEIIISFIVNKEGKIDNLNIERAICKACVEEVKKVFWNMPLWSPGKKDGKPVSIKLYLSIPFVLK